MHLLKPIPVWMRYNNNFPVKIMAWAHTNGSGTVVGKHTDIASFADLGGTQIAVPYWYSMHNVVLQIALRSVDIVPVIKDQSEKLAANECNLLVMATPDMPAAGPEEIYGVILTPLEGDSYEVSELRPLGLAEQAGLRLFDQVTAVDEEQVGQPSKYLVYPFGLLLLGVVIASQLIRRRWA